MTAWQRREPLVCAAGDHGGDQQVGEAYDAKWVRELPGGVWAAVYRYYYLAENSDNGRFLEEQTEYLACTNPGDPGSTELGSNDAYAYVTSVPPLDERAVQDAARDAWAPTNAEWNNAMPAWEVPW